jgi:hypothetical protein
LKPSKKKPTTGNGYCLPRCCLAIAGSFLAPSLTGVVACLVTCLAGSFLAPSFTTVAAAILNREDSHTLVAGFLKKILWSPVIFAAAHCTAAACSLQFLSFLCEDSSNNLFSSPSSQEIVEGKKIN